MLLRIGWLFAAVSFGVLFCSCSRDPKAPTKLNFEQVISPHLANQHACIVVSVPRESPDFRGKHEPVPDLDALVQVGLVEKASAMVKPNFNQVDLFHPNQQVPGVRYQLSKEASKYLHNDVRIRAMSAMGAEEQLCYADKRLADVLRWTEPAATRGRTITEVTYTYKLVDVANWARNADVERAFFTNRELAAADNSMEAKTTLVLMNDGWHVPESTF